MIALFSVRLQITIMNAMRKKFQSGRVDSKKVKESGQNEFAGRVFVSSGLGGMSGAQAKAAVIAGCIGVIAEV